MAGDPNALRPFLESMGSLYSPEAIAEALILTQNLTDTDENFLELFVLRLIGEPPVGLHALAIKSAAAMCAKCTTYPQTSDGLCNDCRALAHETRLPEGRPSA